ncbi:spore germination protein [Siminovitchia acidinfaciens]|uniref:Spore germination protein n=1 Tax=Siminovitchia acidinfaciens TaxID=2321395 RepID=A0A429XTT7_9BACI|nr:spore germination protein [Siminovitchia acidinfaciens]RST71249.1 spore germination protein [Siminovitchia acidinfaciens]
MSFFKKYNGKPLKTMGNQEKEVKPLFPLIEDNIDYICKAFYNTDDLKMRQVTFRGKQGKLIYLDTIADTKEIQRSFLIPLSEAGESQSIEELITSVELHISASLKEAVSQMLSGCCALFFEGGTEIYLFNTLQVNVRTPDEPENEKVVRGSHEGFVEKLNVNLNLVRERIKNRQLTIRYFELGWESKTNLAVIYISDLADPSLVEEVQKRIESISTDMVFSPGYIEECLEDSPFSPFPQILFTERPDRLEAHLMEGRIAVMSEGTSDVSIVPVSFFAFFQTPDDFNIRFYAGSVFRLLRLFSFWGALTLPPIYIAVVGFHYEIIPQDVVTIVKSSIENIPFPPLIEAIVMAITIELIREAGIRLPTPIGQTIGIVGGLIIGDAVVNAGIVSNVMIIVIALTAIMSFTIPSYEMGNTIRILSLPIMIGAATLGFVGIVFSLMIIIMHMCKLESFGSPYLSPVAPVHFKDLKDSFVRFPVWLLNSRPKNAQAQNTLKQKASREWKKE